MENKGFWRIGYLGMGEGSGDGGVIRLEDEDESL